MALSTLIQIPCHHVLTNQNALKFKKGAPLKQFFNINVGIGIIKKTTIFCCIFDICPCVLLKFQSGELIGWGIKFCIQRVPTQHTFDRPRYPKKKEILEKRDDDVIITFFKHFLFFG